jgi:hypothetical protein
LYAPKETLSGFFILSTAMDRLTIDPNAQPPSLEDSVGSAIRDLRLRHAVVAHCWRVAAIARGVRS